MLKSTSLLLLSAPPSEITIESITASYSDSIILVVNKLKKLPFITDLIVAVDWPVLHGSLTSPRMEIFHDAQKLLGCLYSAIYSVCIKLNTTIDSNLPGSIDARIIMLDCSSKVNSVLESKFTTTIGPFFFLQDLVRAPYAWNEIFSAENIESQKLLHKFLELKHQQSAELLSPVTEDAAVSSPFTLSLNLSPRTIHSVVAVGGTFDHLHAGHKLLLTAMTLLVQRPAYSQSHLRLVVGVTGDELLSNKKYAEFLRSWEQRQEDVMKFILSILSFNLPVQKTTTQSVKFCQTGQKLRTTQTKIESLDILIECIEIHDPFGPTITDQEITALVVSGETRSGGQLVNQRRAEMGWRQLEVFEVDVLSTKEAICKPVEDFASKISSTEIRRLKAESNNLTCSE